MFILDGTTIQLAGAVTANTIAKEDKETGELALASTNQPKADGSQLEQLNGDIGAKEAELAGARSARTVANMRRNPDGTSDTAAADSANTRITDLEDELDALKTERDKAQNELKGEQSRLDSKYAADKKRTDDDKRTAQAKTTSDKRKAQNKPSVDAGTKAGDSKPTLEKIKEKEQVDALKKGPLTASESDSKTNDSFHKQEISLPDSNKTTTGTGIPKDGTAGSQTSTDPLNRLDKGEVGENARIIAETIKIAKGAS